MELMHLLKHRTEADLIIFWSGIEMESGGAPMEYKTTLSNLFFLIIHADGKVSQNELSRGREMMLAEGIDELHFNLMMEDLKLKDKKDILRNSILALKKMERQEQIRCIAWLCVIANADGFMDREEWSLIYSIYQTELNLKLDDVMHVQKRLNKLIHEKAFKKHQNNSFAIL